MISFSPAHILVLWLIILTDTSNFFFCLFTLSADLHMSNGIIKTEKLLHHQIIYGIIEHFHSCGQHLCKFIGTKGSVCIRKAFNTHGTGLGHQRGRRFIVLGHQYGCRDVV